VCEATFQHVLPNFKECVWDSWGLDILTFNAFGGCSREEFVALPAVQKD
jgi:hypothetical protein